MGCGSSSAAKYTTRHLPTDKALEVREGFLREVLSEHVMFSRLEKEQISAMVAQAKPRYVSRGELVVREGQQMDVLWVVAEGGLEGHTAMDAHAKGPASVRVRIGPRALLGDVSIATGARQEMTVEAATQAELWGIAAAAIPHSHAISSASMRRTIASGNEAFKAHEAHNKHIKERRESDEEMEQNLKKKKKEVEDFTHALAKKEHDGEGSHADYTVYGRGKKAPPVSMGLTTNATATADERRRSMDAAAVAAGAAKKRTRVKEWKERGSEYDAKDGYRRAEQRERYEHFMREKAAQKRNLQPSINLER